mgnify:CR=1 FL=1|jgi:hypothetical protein
MRRDPIISLLTFVISVYSIPIKKKIYSYIILKLFCVKIL